MLIVQLTKELNGLIAELHEWREVGHALKRLEARYPDLPAALAEERQRIRAEAAAPPPPMPSAPAPAVSRRDRPRRNRRAASR